MPGTTPNGVPYAEPTDPLVQWPATSRSLAEAVDAKIMTQTAQPAPVLDANWLVTQGLYFTEGQTVTSLPEPGVNGWLSVWRDPGGAGVQFFIKQDAPQLGVWYRTRMRTAPDGEWSPWYNFLPVPIP